MTNTPHDLRGTSNANGQPDQLGRLAYSVPEASAAIGIGKTKLYALIGEGILPSTTIGKRRVIRSADLHSLIAGEFGRAN